jgi:RNA polymerase sigma-70 factor (ECF subfamily)
MQKQFSVEKRFAALMKAAQTGNKSAYVQLLEEITPRLRQAIRRQRMFLDPSDIEDLVQDVLLSLHAVRSTYDPERPFMPWLFAIMKNRMADSARRQIRIFAHELQVDDLAVTFSDNPENIDEEVYRDPEALRLAIETLPQAQRQAIDMLKLREMSLKEASSVSGMSIGALKVSVHRAMAALRKALKDG